jgi:hypothetical protein
MANSARLNKVNVSGLAQLKKELTEGLLKKVLQNSEPFAFHESAYQTGANRNSIESKITAPGEGWLFAGGDSYTDKGDPVFVDYAADLEFDHPTHAGFLRNAPGFALRSMGIF